MGLLLWLFFDLFGPYFNVVWPSVDFVRASDDVGYIDYTQSAHGDEEHVTTDIRDEAPTRWPKTEDDGEKFKILCLSWECRVFFLMLSILIFVAKVDTVGYLLNMIGFDTFISPQDSEEDEVARPPLPVPEFHMRDLECVDLVKGLKSAIATFFRAVMKETKHYYREGCPLQK